MNFIDLFAGAGGLSEGFIRAGFKPIAHVESDKAACNTLLTRICYNFLKTKGDLNKYYNYIRQDGISRDEIYNSIPSNLKCSVINLEIGEKNNKTIFETIDELRNGEKIDLIIGGPPCQAYSVAGRSRDINGMKGDSRNFLYVEYAKFLERFNPKYFVFENVTGLLSAKNEDGSFYLPAMISLFESVGYVTELQILNAKDFGVLQNRRRVILIGRRGKKHGFYPEFETWHPEVKVDEIFKDLPKLQAGEGSINFCSYKKYSGKYLFDSKIRNDIDFTTHHIARPHTNQDKEIYRIVVDTWNTFKKRYSYNDLPDSLKTHQNRKGNLDRFKVVASDLNSSHTVVAHISRDGHYYIHPDISQNRSITPREAARLQSFPDNYFFEGISSLPSRTAAFKQIGNAVPPLMAFSIAKGLKRLFNNY